MAYSSEPPSAEQPVRYGRRLVDLRLWLPPLLFLVIAVLLGLQNYLLFHTVAELAAIVVGFMMFATAWQTYPFSRTDFTMILGCGYFWVALLDLTHILAFPGMTVLPDSGSNAAVQLWLSGRGLEAAALLLAVLLLGHPVRRTVAFTGFGLAALAALALIGTGLFPAGYVEGTGLTSFKVGAEYAIIALLAATLGLLARSRRQLAPDVFGAIALAIGFTMAAELAFTLYVDVYGFFNLVGHLFKILSYWMLFIAVSRSMLLAPYRRLQQAKTEAQASEERFALAMKGTNDGLWDWDVQAGTVYYSPRWKSMLGYAEDEIGDSFREWQDRVHPDDIGPAMANIEAYLAGRTPGFEQEFRMRHKDGSWVHVLARGEGVWDADGTLTRLVGTHVDLTPLKRSEQTLARQTRELQERNKELSTHYAVAEILHDPDCSLEEALARVADRLPAGWQYPDAACARILWEDQTFLSPGFEPGAWKQEADIVVAGVREGSIEVHYCDEFPAQDEGPFLRQERQLLDDIAKDIATRIARTRDERRLQEEGRARRELEAIVEHSPAVAFLWRAAEGWPVDYVSDNVRQFGYTPDDFLSGRVPYASMIAPEDVDRVAEEIERHTVQGRNAFTQEYRILDSEGVEHWVDDRTWIRRDAEGAVTHYQGLILDISERKRAEQALERANRALQTISLCNEALVRAGSEDELFRGVCDAFVREGGYPLAWIGGKEDAPGRPVTPLCVTGEERDYLDEVEISWAEDRPTGRGPTGTAIRSGRPVVVRDTAEDPEYAPWRAAAARHGFRSSIALPLTAGTEVIGNLTLCATQPDAFDADETRLLTELAADISHGVQALRSEAARRRAERDLGISTQQLKTITDRNLDAMVVIDTAGSIRFANPAAEALFGRTLAVDGEQPLGLPASTRTWQRIDILRPDGRPVVAEMRSVPIPWQGEDCRLLVLRDVTERLEMERTIDHLERMETLGSLAAGIVHDIKNMLLPIISLSELNMKALPPDSREFVRAGKVLEAARRLQDMAVGLLAFSRRSEDEVLLEEVSIHAVVRGALELLRGTLPSTVSVIPDLDENAGRISVDASRLADALLNLATNAADAMEGSVGELHLTTGRVTVSADSVPNVVPVPPGTYVRLAVTDTGPGMDAATRARAFDPFFTTKGEGRGTGLGLPMVLDFARRHDAGLGVTSAPGQGTTFEILFPAQDSANG